MTIYNAGLSGVGKGKKFKDATIKFIKPCGEYLYGINSVSAAISNKRRIFKIAYIKENAEANEKLSEIAKRFISKNIPLQYATRDTLNKLSENRPHQGIVVDASPLAYEKFVSQNITLPPDCAIWLFLHDIKDPMNLGAILRSAIYFGIKKITVSMGTCPLSNVVSKASSGAVEYLKISQTWEPIKTIKTFHNIGWQIIATALESSNPKAILSNQIQNLAKKPTLLIIGNEGQGLPEILLEQCHACLVVPSKQKLNTSIDSLNVSVATGILLHQLATQLEQS